MNHIAPLLSLEAICLDRDISSRKRAFEELSLIIEQSAGLSHQEVFNALIARERLGCTCLGGGVAIPHGRVAGLDEMVLAILRTNAPVMFDTPDNRRARLFFCVMIPEGDEDKYLDVLSEISALLKDLTSKEKLLNVASPLALCEFIATWQPPADENTEPAS